MEIVYYGLNKAYVEQAQDWLGAVNQHPTFNHAGSEAMVITLKALLKKATVVMVLLTESEYDKAVVNNTNKFKNVKLDKIYVVKSLDDLKSKLEELFGVKLGVLEEPEPEVVVVDEPLPVAPEIEEPVVERVEQIVEEKVDTTKVRGVSKLAIAQLKEEITVLKREKEELEKKLLSGGAGSSEADLVRLNEQVKELKRVIQVKDEDIKGLRQSISELDADLVLKDKEIRDVKRGIFKKEVIRVPDNIEFYVAASGVSLMHAYEYLLLENDEGLIVDLSRESFVDVFVKLKSPVRPDKWLADGINIRAAFTAFDVKDSYDVSKELRLITAPAYALPLSLYRDIDWGIRFKEASKLGIPVMFFLGDITQEGVIDFANRLEGIEVNVLRRDNKLDLRAYNKAHKYINRVNEVVMRGES